MSLSSPRPPDPNASFLSPKQGSNSRPTSPNPRSPRSPGRSPAPSPRLGPPPKKDFSFLLKPEIYHTLSPNTIPAPFRDSPHQPDPETPIPDLVARGQYRAAAVAAVQQLTGTAGHTAPSSDDHARIFSLLHTRLACLTLIDATNIAAQEVKALEDVQSPFYLANPIPTPAPSIIASPTTAVGLGIDAVAAGQPPHSPSPSFLAAQQQDPPEHLVPWELRVLAVRLQSLGFGDPRRSVMSYYELAREARARLARATANHDNSARELWRGRLAELGLRVAGALIEMDDLSGAAAHLASLPAVHHGTGRLATARALLWLHLGDVDAARACVDAGRNSDSSSTPDSSRDKVISALCDMANGDYESALETWTDLREELPRDEMVGVNTAVCLLYVGKMEQVGSRLPSPSIGLSDTTSVLTPRYCRVELSWRKWSTRATRPTLSCSTSRPCTSFARSAQRTRSSVWPSVWPPRSRASRVGRKRTRTSSCKAGCGVRRLPRPTKSVNLGTGCMSPQSPNMLLIWWPPQMAC